MSYDVTKFESFWAAYPKKRAKLDAERAWKKIRPTLPLYVEILTALEAHKQSRDWQKNEGMFIPYPASWLRGGRWTDVLEVERRVEDRSPQWCRHVPRCVDAGAHTRKELDEKLAC